jgi:hypothetical protein
MAKNQVQFQRGYSLFEFMDDYGSEEKCEQTLFQWRFPEGYVCRVNLTRYHGVLAPNSKHRAQVTPAKRGRGKNLGVEGTLFERRKAMT